MFIVGKDSLNVILHFMQSNSVVWGFKLQDLLARSQNKVTGGTKGVEHLVRSRSGTSTLFFYIDHIHIA